MARKYRLLSPLGQGATATIWVAENLALNTRVAVKILRAMLIHDPRLVARVREEARMTASITHKNIVQVFDFGITTQGAPFIVMELLRGETLADRLKNRGRLPTAEAVPIVLRAMKGVTVAHAKGIVHRDLKPENIFLAVDETGVERPKVLDFGVSFIAGEGGTTGQHFTRTGVLIGTPAYLPPEVIRAEQRADARADVWALGVLLYEMIAGRSPFAGTNIHTLMNAIVNEPPQMLEGVVPDVDAQLDAILGRALAKKPDERFPTMRAFFDELHHWFEGHHPGGALSRFSQRIAQSEPIDPVFADDEGPTYVAGSTPASDPSVVAAAPPPSGPVSGALRGSSRPLPPPAPQRPHLPHPSRPSSRPPPASHEALPLYAARSAHGEIPLAPPSAGRTLGPVVARPRARSRLRLPGIWWVGMLATSVIFLAACTLAVTLFWRSRPAGMDRSLDVPLQVLAVPPNARVTVNGELASLPVLVRRGTTVVIRVEAADYLPWQQEIAAEGAVRLTFAGIRREGAPKPF